VQSLEPISIKEQSYVNEFLKDINDISEMNTRFQTSIQAKNKQTQNF